jgi:hypothetical protein
VRRTISPPQHLADEHTLLAQKYAGYFLGHPYRAVQQSSSPGAITIEWQKPWKEPAVASDGCAFCARLTDGEAVRRVTGYQHAIDIEVLRARSNLYADWLALARDVPDSEEVTIAGVTKRRGISISPQNRRRFIELHADKFEMVGVNMIELPLRLKRKLCIEWNHLYRDWLRANPDTQYDFEKHEFFQDIVERVSNERLSGWWATPDPLAGGAV